MSSQPVDAQPAAEAQPPKDRWGYRRMLFAVGAIAVLAALIMLSLNSGQDVSYLTGGSSVLVLAVPAFLAGVLSFLSPCTLPILPAYFAFTFQAGKRGVFMMSVAFFFGLATTITLLGASATALSGLIFDNRQALTFWGGIVIIAFGLMGMFGKGFAGPQIQERPAATVLGSYVYGATFALGWTACVGPILGALLTLLATTSGVAILQGAVLAFIYALGLGTPLILLSTFFNRLGNGSSFWKVIRGKGFEVNILGRSLFLHSTSLMSGMLMVAMGVLLASGQLEAISRVTNSSDFAQWWVQLESGVGRLFGLQ
ncbi:cytochrome c biogenesis CcdA family protein [Oscillochloris sp. ZM17-4]|uniref:cytochrome c biogenesis CcdA family protein n=1 Tax=Oscillochloris sp. ZM17-4 TaxID=2866714 RepID=UPI001C730934|nr:cytochrome c biogenesis CcdA family protein [Oscillochloris sp. ZM17-4]MBX0327067.1 cytochrome c biogenesis CcdA family protein [Oscillochloris sp. ZM17-4]